MTKVSTVAQVSWLVTTQLTNYYKQYKRRNGRFQHNLDYNTHL